MAEYKFPFSTGRGTFGASGTFGGGSTFGGGNRRPSLASLIGEDAANLQRTSQSIARLQTQAEALGAQDTTGKGPRGFLTGALDYLTRGQSGTLGFITGLAGMEREGETQGALQRALAGFSGKERFTGGDVIGKAAPGASYLERTARGIAGFGIDVATDPLNLLTFGRGGALRGVGAGAAAEAQVARSARKVLEPVQTPEVPVTTPVTASSASTKASETALTRAGDIRTADQPITSLGTPRTTATQAPVIPDRVSPVEPIAPIRVETNDEFVERLTKAAGEGQVLAGGRGTRNAMLKVARERYTAPGQAEDVVDRILKGTTGEVRGGIGLRLPFTGRDISGQITTAGEAATRRVADLTPGAGRLVDELGLRSVAEDARSIFNGYRSSKFFRGYSSIFNGKTGAAYADFIRTAHTGKGGMDYATFTKLLANDSKQTAAVAVRDKAFSSFIQASSKMADEAEDPQAVKAAVNKYYQMADDMALEPNASAADELGFKIASGMRDFGNNVYQGEILDAAARAGVEIGEVVRNFLPRPLSLKELRLRASRGQKTGTYSAGKSRTLGFETDEFGRLDSRSNVELNQDFIDRGLRDPGHEVFETDAFKIATQQLASYSKILSELNLIADLKATLPLVAATAQTARLVNVPNLVQQGGRYESALVGVADRLTAAMNTALANGDAQQVDRIGKALTKIAADGTTIKTLLANINDTDPTNLRVIGNLAKVLKGALAAGETAGITLTKAEKARLFSAKGLVTTKSTSGNRDELLAAGLVPIGSGDNVRIPRGLDNLYADEAVKDAVERYFKVETGILRDSAFFNEVYQPYYTLLKTWLTVGRPGGYHLRNLQGAWWNNYLGDVSGADHRLSASVLNETRKANDAATVAIDNIRAGRASGLTGDEDALARDIVQIGRERGSDVVDIERDNLANYILVKRMEKIKVGDSNMADVLEAARNQGVLRDNRQLEYLRDEARSEGTELADALANPQNRNLFKGVSQAELNTRQRILNKAVNNAYIRVSGDVAELSENYVRLAAFISGARRYGVADNGTAAGYLTKALQFDYADLSDAERNVIKNIIPFYTWTRRNVPLQFSALLSNPGKFNKLDFAKEELQNQFGAEGDQAGMDEIIPEWMREKMGFVTMFNTAGGPLSISGPGFESPAFDLNRYLAISDPRKLSSYTGVAGRVSKEIVSASNPLIKAIAEYATGVDLFTGSKFPENGVASPFGPDRPVLGITFTGPDGDQRVDAQGYGLLKDLLPPLGLIARLGSPGEADRRLSNWLSTIAGAPVSTLTPGQLSSELYTREDRIKKQVNRLGDQYGLDKDWLRQIAETSTADEIRSYIAAGLGKATRPEK
jgi:hypothetical protein